MKEKLEKFDLDADVGRPGWQKRRSELCKTPMDSESFVEQHHKDSCDINVIMARYEKTGVLPMKDGQPYFGDFTGVVDFQTAQNALIEAEEAFMQLPAKVRSRFQNDPHQLLTFLEDKANRDEAIALGLIQEPAATTPEAPPAKVEDKAP